MPRAHSYRARQRAVRQTTSAPPPATRPRPRSPRALREDEQARVLEVLRSARFADLAPREVYATLLDEGV